MIGDPCGLNWHRVALGSNWPVVRSVGLADLVRPQSGTDDTAKPRSWGKASSRSPQIGSRPSANDLGRGEPFPVAQRQRSSRPQAASGEWGAKPRAPREARLPPSDLRCAQAVPAGHGVGASSTEAQPKSSESVANRRRRLRRR